LEIVRVEYGKGMGEREGKMRGELRMGFGFEK
jgi:hypothetical protein